MDKCATTAVLEQETDAVSSGYSPEFSMMLEPIELAMVGGGHATVNNI